MAIDPLRKKNQLTQGGAGSQGTVSDQSGTGALQSRNETPLQTLGRGVSTGANIIGNLASDVGKKVYNEGVIPAVGNAVIDTATGIGKNVVTPVINTGLRIGFGQNAPQIGQDNSPTPSSLPDKSVSTIQPNPAVTSPSPFSNNGKTLTLGNGIGGSASITSEKQFTPDQASSLDKTLAFNAKQSTKDMFARDAQNTADMLAKYGDGKEDPNARLRQFYQNQLAYEASQPFKRTALINHYADALQGLDTGNIAKQNVANESQKLGFQNAFKTQDQNIENQKAIDNRTNEAFKLINANTAATGITNPVYNLGVLKQAGVTPKLGDLGNLVSSEQFSEFNKLETPEEKGAWLTSVFGREGADYLTRQE